MTNKCKENRWAMMTFRRCEYKAKKDGYCGIHHPDAVKRRREKREMLEKSRSALRDKQWNRQAFDRRAGDMCRELGIEPEEIKA